jgi:predicted nucleotidyltransferase
MALDTSQALSLARRLAVSYAAWPEVEAVALGGSRATGLADPGSDVDLYVYAAAEPSRLDRAALVAAEGGREAEIGRSPFEPGDEWADVSTGLDVDVMFRTPAIIEDELDRVLVRHQARAGYSTCLWHNVLTSRLLFDRRGFYAALQARAGVGYPEPLRRAVVALNLPLLWTARSSFGHQLARAAARGDGVAVAHRTAALLASAFDVLFALNRAPHPGEKQLLVHLRGTGPLLPPDLDVQVAALLAAAGQPGPGAVRAAETLAESITALCRAEGLVP